MKRLEQYDVYDLTITDIFCDSSFNCRGSFTLPSVHDLAESIRENGLQFPVVVQPWEGKWRLLAGHRRYRAISIFLKWTTIPASIRFNLTEHQARILNLTENLERKDLNMLEEARAIHNLYPEGVSLRKAAAELKRPTRWLNIRLRLLKLPREVQQKAASGVLSAVNIEVICRLDSAKKQIEAAKVIARAKKKGKTKFQNINPMYKRKFVPRKSKEQISKMIIRLWNMGIEDTLATRLLAWVTGYVTDQEINADLDEYKQTHKMFPRDKRVLIRMMKGQSKK